MFASPQHLIIYPKSRNEEFHIYKEICIRLFQVVIFQADWLPFPLDHNCFFHHCKYECKWKFLLNYGLCIWIANETRFGASLTLLKKKQIQNWVRHRRMMASSGAADHQGLNPKEPNPMNKLILYIYINALYFYI